MKHIKNLTNLIKDEFRKILGSLIDKPIEDAHYNPLTPTDNADDCEIYLKTFEWALSQSKVIKNIAVAGPHGSGKSSIIQTFIVQHLKSEKYLQHLWFPKYKFLNISLATFRETTNKNKQEKDGQEKNIDDNELQRLIELSILQQLFFMKRILKYLIPDLKRLNGRKRLSFSDILLGLLQ